MQALNHHIARDGFRLRGTQMERIDAFSDVVFGFALTLLVVSLEVPRTYPELIETLRGFFPFAISFLLLMLVWHAHYKFFRRYATHDAATILINSLLLFVILFYVYPLKFLFSFVALALSGANHVFTEVHQLTGLMVIYGVGFTAIYTLLAALYANAWRQRDQLALTPLELLLTRYYFLELATIAFIGLASCIFALLLPPRAAGYAGYTYLLIWPASSLISRRSRRQAATLLARNQASQALAQPAAGATEPV